MPRARECDAELNAPRAANRLDGFFLGETVRSVSTLFAFIGGRPTSCRSVRDAIDRLADLLERASDALGPVHFNCGSPAEGQDVNEELQGDEWSMEDVE